MTDSQITCFLCVAKYLNFTEAANHLFMAQSSLSRNISNLETELGIRLFTRTKKYVRLTPGGAVLYQEFSRLMEEGKSAIQKARHAELGQEGSIKLGVIETQRSENFLPAALNALRKKHSGIQFHLFRGNFKELRESLLKNRIDIALTMDFDLPDYPEQKTIYQPFFQTNLRCVISRSHPLADQPEISLADLKEDPLIAIAPHISRGAYYNILELCEESGFSPSNISCSNSIQDTLLMVESGLGFSVLDENCISSANEAIRSIPLVDTTPIELVAVWKKENFNPVLPLFINLLGSSSHQIL